MRHVRKYLNAARGEPLDLDGIRAILREPYFIPEGTGLLDQLQNFQERLRHIALVVDEYGEILQVQNRMVKVARIQPRKAAETLEAEAA